MKRVGFTLIELLIVVAIIAILAAIAIPNFLQAQVRAKVSRTQSDMRSIATGLESYYVDHNEYIPDYMDGEKLGDWTLFYRYLPRLVYLTTPIAYMTSVPGDPFAEGPAASEIPQLRGPYLYADGEPMSPLTYDFSKQHMDLIAEGNDRHIGAWERIAINVGLEPQNRAQLAWVLRSVGPDGISVPLSYTTEELRALGVDIGGGVPYDPTNGTVSSGQIYRSNMGQH